MVGERYGGDVNATTNTSRVRKKHLKIIKSFFWIIVHYKYTSVSILTVKKYQSRGRIPLG